jgi:short-subunit dehydrogenase
VPGSVADPKSPLRLCALVTGASSGIGEAFARSLHRRGDRLVLVARRRDRLEALAHELGGETFPLVADLSAPGAAERVVRSVAQRGLAIDLLINNAGLGHSGPFESQPPDSVRAIVDVNMRALVELTRAVIPGMRSRGRGRIVNVASNAAFQPVPFMTLYAASKAFVLSFTEGLAGELRGSGISLQALCPGITETEFLDVAGTHSGLLVRRMPLLSAAEVVASSLRGLERDRLRVIVGWPNRVLAFAVQRLAPRALARLVAGELYRPRGGASPAEERS